MSGFKVGDRVYVSSECEGDYSGPGTVTRINSYWVEVQSDTAWDEHTSSFPFPSGRVRRLDEAQVTHMIARHPNSARFHALLEEAAALHDAKQADYGSAVDPFANVRASSDWGIAAWIGTMVRLNDKVKRLQSLAQKGELVNEAAVDSFMDIAVYALIARVLYEEQNKLYRGTCTDCKAQDGPCWCGDALGCTC